MDKVKRPPSVWITQAIILLFLALLLFGGTFPIARCLANGGAGCFSVEVLLRFIFIVGGVATFLVFTFLGLLRRKKYGRWLGVAALVLLLGVMLVGEQSRMAYSYILSGGGARRAMPPEYYGFSNDTQLISAVVSTVLLHVALIVLILRLAFAESVRRFFGSGVVPGVRE